MKTKGIKPIVRSKPPAARTNLTQKSSTSASNNLAHSQYKQLSQERKRYRAMEQSAPEPIRQHAQNKGQLINNRLADLQRKINQSK